MGVPYAEVIGDPVAHSQSPLIHKFWLGKLGLEGDYRRHLCSSGGVERYLRERCADPFWRGCSVTAPLKPEAARVGVDPSGICTRIGAANALFRSPLGCAVAANTDLQGIAAALGSPIAKACVIGAGGAARAVLEYLRLRQVREVAMLVRQPAKARRMRFGGSPAVHSLAEARAALAGADLLVNATPLGMAGRPAMPQSVLGALESMAPQARILDMVYVPVETELLRCGRAAGLSVVDGLALLVGQAAPAFELFFGRAAPREHDEELREMLTS